MGQNWSVVGTRLRAPESRGSTRRKIAEKVMPLSPNTHRKVLFAMEGDYRLTSADFETKALGIRQSNCSISLYVTICMSHEESSR